MRKRDIYSLTPSKGTAKSQISFALKFLINDWPNDTKKSYPWKSWFFFGFDTGKKLRVTLQQLIKLCQFWLPNLIMKIDWPQKIHPRMTLLICIHFSTLPIPEIDYIPGAKHIGIWLPWHNFSRGPWNFLHRCNRLILQKLSILDKDALFF